MTKGKAVPWTGSWNRKGQRAKLRKWASVDTNVSVWLMNCDSHAVSMLHVNNRRSWVRSL